MSSYLHEYFDNQNSYINLFIFICILISLFVLNKGFLLILIIISICIYFYNDIIIDNIQKHINETKKNFIQSSISHSNDHLINRNDIIKFLFSIQDMYHYNPIQYEIMTKNINQFFEYMDISLIDRKNIYFNYDHMTTNKRNALNALSSLIFSVPSHHDTIIRNKINKANSILDDIMKKYIDQMSFLVDEYTYKNGYNTDTKIINYGPKPYNEYTDIFGKYSYEIY